MVEDSQAAEQDRQRHGSQHHVQGTPRGVALGARRPPTLHHVTSRVTGAGHKVLKTNSFRYRGNSYSLPLGTYRGEETRVLVEERDGMETATLLSMFFLCLNIRRNRLLVAQYQHNARIEQRDKKRIYRGNLLKFISMLQICL